MDLQAKSKEQPAREDFHLLEMSINIFPPNPPFLHLHILYNLGELEVTENVSQNIANALYRYIEVYNI